MLLGENVGILPQFQPITPHNAKPSTMLFAAAAAALLLASRVQARAPMNDNCNMAEVIPPLTSGSGTVTTFDVAFDAVGAGELGSPPSVYHEEGIVSATTSGATLSTEAKFCAGGGGAVDGQGVWYSYTPAEGTFGGTVIFDTCKSSTAINTKIHVYTGACDDLDCVLSDDDHQGYCDDLYGGSIDAGYSAVAATLKGGTTYYIHVSQFDLTPDLSLP